MANPDEVLNRSISRGLNILQVINRRRTLSMADISIEAGIPYPTARRIVRTLIDEGMIEQEPGRKRYRPTALVRSLSVGYQFEDWLASNAWPILARTTNKIKWPVYVCSRIGRRMLVNLSTDALTTLTFTRCYPGYTTPLLESSSGKAFLAFSADDERQMILDSVFHDLSAPSHHDRAAIEAELTATRQRGYAIAQYMPYTEEPGRSSGISLPILGNDGRVLATISMIFFAAAMSPAEAAAHYLSDLQEAVDGIAACMLRDATSGVWH